MSKMPTRFQGSHIARQKQIDPPVVVGGWTPEQVNLVKRTYAKDATNDELAIFLAMCNRMQLDPFAKQIYFTKFGGKVTIMVGIDGARLIAQRSGRMSGIKRGVIKDEDGKILYGWCEIHVKGWERTVYEETPFVEYVQNQGQWKSRPETMIKKCAEMAALRMAFPQELSGVYSPEEMGLEEKVVEAKDLSERFKLEGENGSKNTGGEPKTDNREVPSSENDHNGNLEGIAEDGFSDITANAAQGDGK